MTLNSSGDPIEASSILDRAEEHTIALGQISEKIPAIVAKLEDDFPDQLDDLESGYRKLIEQNYHFPEKISNVASKKFVKLSVLTQVNWFLLIWTVRKKKTLRFKIKSTTCIVFSNVKLPHTRLLCVIRKFCQTILNTLKKTTKKLQEELERLMLTYIFDETYAADVRSFASDISGVETAVLPTLENFEAQVKPFSELEKDL